VKLGATVGWRPHFGNLCHGGRGQTGTRIWMRMSDRTVEQAPSISAPPDRAIGRSRRRRQMSHARAVVVAEDDHDLRELLQLHLEGAGHEVRPARDGRQALALFAGDPPDVLVTDLQMPHMDGLTLCARSEPIQPCDRWVSSSCRPPPIRSAWPPPPSSTAPDWCARRMCGDAAPCCWRSPQWRSPRAWWRDRHPAAVGRRRDGPDSRM
jgi:response regulator receiver domain-containing protein